MTYDPALPLYTLTITRDLGWSDAAMFGIRFYGGLPLTITTNHHNLGAEDRALSVADTGFGNVLEELARNELAIAFAGDARVATPLEGAAPAVAAVLSCRSVPAV